MGGGAGEAVGDLFRAGVHAHRAQMVGVQQRPQYQPFLDAVVVCRVVAIGGEGVVALLPRLGDGVSAGQGPQLAVVVDEGECGVGERAVELAGPARALLRSSTSSCPRKGSGAGVIENFRCYRTTYMARCSGARKFVSERSVVHASMRMFAHRANPARESVLR